MNAQLEFNKKRNSFITLSLLIIIGRSFDATTTYLYTPDSNNESNILVQ